MPKRTDISSILIIGAGLAPSPRRGEGWGEGVRRLGVISNALRPHPTLPRTGEGLGASRCSAVSGDSQMLENRFQNAIEIARHVAVPEPDDGVSVDLDEASAFGIGLGRFGVLAPVQLNDEPGASASEIGDGGADRELSDEFAAVELAAAQARPKYALAIGHVATEFARDRSQAFPGHTRQPNTPSPRRGDGRGEGARRLRVAPEARHPHPTLSLQGEGFEDHAR